MGLFNSRFRKVESGVIHSNGFAEAADKDSPSFGATSPETFSQRRAIDRNRQHIERFQNALIHHDYRAQRMNASPSTPQPTADTPAKRPLNSLTNTERPVVQRPSSGYREPSSRGFNPFR